MDIITGPGKYKNAQGRTVDIVPMSEARLGVRDMYERFPWVGYYENDGGFDVFDSDGALQGSRNHYKRIISRIPDEPESCACGAVTPCVDAQPEWKAGDECEWDSSATGGVVRGTIRFIEDGTAFVYSPANALRSLQSIAFLRRPVKQREWTGADYHVATGTITLTCGTIVPNVDMQRLIPIAVAALNNAEAAK